VNSIPLRSRERRFESCRGHCSGKCGTWPALRAETQFVAYMETADFGKALSLFSASRDEFDMWFKRRLVDSTGLDLNNPPSMQLPELLSCYPT